MRAGRRALDGRVCVRVRMRTVRARVIWSVRSVDVRRVGGCYEFLSRRY